MASKNDEIGVPQSPFFMEYHKILEDTTKWEIKDLNKIKEWIVLEKVHGANFSFYISNTGVIRVARRGDFLSSGEFFFGVHKTNIIPETSEKLRHLYKQISSKYPNIEQLSLHGELFGGEYNTFCQSCINSFELVCCIEFLVFVLTNHGQLNNAISICTTAV